MPVPICKLRERSTIWEFRNNYSLTLMYGPHMPVHLALSAQLSLVARPFIEGRRTLATQVRPRTGGMSMPEKTLSVRQPVATLKKVNF